MAEVAWLLGSTLAAAYEVAPVATVAAGITSAAVEGAAGYGLYRTAKRYYEGDDGDGVRKKLKFDTSTNMSAFGKRCSTRTTKSGKKKKMGVALIRRMLIQSQQYCISRFQSLPDGGVFDDITKGATKKLGYFHQTTQNRVYLPVYCFNMTALPVNANNFAGVVDLATNYPFYRLYKDMATNVYRWAVQQGFGNEPAGNVEDSRWAPEDTSCTKAAQIDDYTIEWLNIRLLFKGATSRPNDIEISEVSFPGKAGPVRNYVQIGAVRVEDELPTGDEENECTVFWDHYLAPRTTHPLRTSYLPPNAIDKQLIKYSTKKISIMPVTESMEVNTDFAGSSTSMGVLPLMHCENIFKRMNKIIKVRSDNPNASNSGAIINSTTSNFPAYNSNTSTSQCALFQPREKERWLMITAKTFARAGGTTEDTYADLWRLFPSFDMVIRQKILWNQDT